MKCFCKVWLNIIILYQAVILLPNSGADQKKKRLCTTNWFYFSPEFLNFALKFGWIPKQKGLCRILVLTQSGILDFLLPSGYCQKTEGTRHISPHSVSDSRGRCPLTPQNWRQWLYCWSNQHKLYWNCISYYKVVFILRYRNWWYTISAFVFLQLFVSSILCTDIISCLLDTYVVSVYTRNPPFVITRLVIKVVRLCSL